MVVGKVMRWSPWAPPSPPKRRYLVRLRVVRLQGLSPAIDGDSTAVAAVAVGWKGPNRGRGIPHLRRRRRGNISVGGGVSGEAAVGVAGDAEWADRKENVFEKVCCFSDSIDGGFDQLEISFSILCGSGAPRKTGKERKLKEVGRAVVNIGAWAWAFHSQALGGGVEGKESHFLAQRKWLPVTLSKHNLTAEATLHVDVRFNEFKKSKDTNQAVIHGDEIIKRSHQGEDHDSSDGRVTDDSCSSPDMDMDVYRMLRIANNEEKTLSSRSRDAPSIHSSSSSGYSSPEQQRLCSVSKRRYLPWGNKSWTKMISVDETNKETQASSSAINSSSNSILNKEHLESTKEDNDPIGKWESKEFISRDRQTKLKAQLFFASIDQLDESAGGESACTALVAVIADALHSRWVNMPTRSEFDALIREGSSEWRRLCDDASYIERFPNKHYDLDTILEAKKTKSISVLPEKSFIGFFQPESFESLRGAMSFDDIWNVIMEDFEGAPKVYIVSWNDHFFILMLESQAYYIIDTLGERLFEGCRKAYMLRFDESTQMFKLPMQEEEKIKGKDEDIEEQICSGKNCCREFIKRFFAAIPLREELEIEEKGQGSVNTALHQRLQIELHYTQASCDVICL